MSLLGWIARQPRKRRGYVVVPFQNSNPIRIFIDEAEIKKHDCSLHTIVRVELVSSRKSQYKARILEVIPSLNDPDFELELVAEEYGFPSVFKKESLLDAAEQASRQGSKGRRDLTNELTVTIDGETAKDYDDAIHVSKLKGKGYLLKVSIADVSFFVQRGRALDVEAFERGSSIYFPGYAIPMLPEVLSNDLCSLVPKQVRNTLTCEMHFDLKGRFKNKKVYASQIKSDARLTYKLVDKALAERPSDMAPAILEMLQNAEELSNILSERRNRLGYLDLDLPESEISTNEFGDVLQIAYTDRLRSHRMIENFMVSANEAVSEMIEERGYPSIYRVHGLPTEEKLQNLKQLFERQGIKLQSGVGHPPQLLQEALKRLPEGKMRKIYALHILRSLKQAEYLADNIGHFGLGSGSYTHFTSPIRRYPDLIVHRILRETQFFKSKKAPYSHAELQEIAQVCSEREQRAAHAERRMRDIKKCRFLEPLVGQQFEAVITSVKEFGFFAELLKFPVDGLVHIRQLPGGHWRVDEAGFALKSGRKNREFRLGDQILVQLSDVDRYLRRVDLRYLKHLD